MKSAEVLRKPLSLVRAMGSGLGLQHVWFAPRAVRELAASWFGGRSYRQVRVDQLPVRASAIDSR